MKRCYLCREPLSGECLASGGVPMMHLDCWWGLPECEICGRGAKGGRCQECIDEKISEIVQFIRSGKVE